MQGSGHVVVCKKRRQEETLVLSGTQRHLGGPLCTNKLQKIACAVVCPCQTARQLTSVHIPRMVLFVYDQELYS